METVNQITSVQRIISKEKTNNATFLSRLIQTQVEGFESARFGWMAILITFQSCLGAAACMFILQGGANLVELITCACITMGSNALFIALASPRLCLAIFYLSVVLNTIFLLLNL